MTLALAGLYGDACVMVAADTLGRRGHASRIVVVRDLCVWKEDPPALYPAVVLCAENLWSGIGAWVAQMRLDPPVHWDGQAIYTWK